MSGVSGVIAELRLRLPLKEMPLVLPLFLCEHWSGSCARYTVCMEPLCPTAAHVNIKTLSSHLLRCNRGAWLQWCRYPQPWCHHSASGLRCKQEMWGQGVDLKPVYFCASPRLSLPSYYPSESPVLWCVSAIPALGRKQEDPRALLASYSS